MINAKAGLIDQTGDLVSAMPFVDADRKSFLRLFLINPTLFQ